MEERGELARIVGKAVLVEGFLRSLPVAFSDPGNEVARATRNCTAARRAAATQGVRWFLRQAQDRLRPPLQLHRRPAHSCGGDGYHVRKRASLHESLALF